jgi:lactoylglutathione lyase
MCARRFFAAQRFYDWAYSATALPGGPPFSVVAGSIAPLHDGHDSTERMAMPTCTWDHIHLRSADPEGTAQWFERMLGAQVIHSTQQGKPRIDLKLGGANIFIAPVAPGDGVNPPPATPHQGLDHFGLAVSGIDAIAAELKSKGVQFSKEPHIPRPGLKICFLRGPQGISIELLDRDPKYV